MGLLNDLKEAKEVAKNLKKEFDASEEGQEIKKDLKQFIHECFFGRPDQTLFQRLNEFHSFYCICRGFILSPSLYGYFWIHRS